MAKKPQRAVVEEIVKNLMDSEISGIQAVAKDMAERVKLIEEHSLRIKQYTDEIEKLAIDTASKDNADLQTQVRDLERTVNRLKKRKTEIEEPVEQVRTKSGIVIPEMRRKAEAKVERPKFRPEVEPEPEEPAKSQFPFYTTPEGFILRKIR
jgi:chromosome segregation ATPase